MTPLRYLLAALLATFLLVLVLIAGPTRAAECPHCEGSGGEALTGDFGANGCTTCHLLHNAPGATLTNTVGINNLCQGCHVSGGMATEVDTHGAARGTPACDFCVYDFTTKCTSCHDPHTHKQPINNTDDPGTNPARDYFIRSEVYVTTSGVSCTDDCPGGQSADPAGSAGECIADPSCTGACAGNETCDNSSGTIICTCPVKYNPTGCSTCDTGFTGATCDTTIDCSVAALGADCGHGTCQSSGGPDCSGTCPGGQYNDDKLQGVCKNNEASCSPACTGDATCVTGVASGNGEAVCVCSVGHTPGQGCSPSNCQDGFDGAGCTVDCTGQMAGTLCGTGPATCQGGGGGDNNVLGTAYNGTTGPSNAYVADGTPESIASSGGTGTVSGFPSTPLGTINSVTLWIRYQTSAAPVDDSYTIQYSTNGGGAWITLVNASFDPVLSYVNLTQPLTGVTTWAGVANVQVRIFTTQKKQPDGYNVDLDAGYLVVNTSGGAMTCTGGTCTTGYINPPNCTECDAASGYVLYDGACIIDPCATKDCGVGGTCYLDKNGQAECNCPNTYWDNNDACGSCDSSFPSTKTCQCLPGYGPPGLCNQCLDKYHPEDGLCVADATGVCGSYGCSPGTCLVNDRSGAGNAIAQCDCPGRYFDNSGQAGSDCNSCTAPAISGWSPIILSGTYNNATTMFSPITNSFADGDSTIDGLCEVCHEQTTHHRRTAGGNGPAAHNAGANCMQSGCHAHVTTQNAALGKTAGFGFMPAQGTKTCDDCHLSAAGGGQDIDSYRWNGTVARIDYSEWLSSGHGSAAIADMDVEPAVGTEHGCAYCHDTNIGHGTAGNYARLANYDALSRGVPGTEANDVCLICHSDGDPGYDPGGSHASIDSALDVDVDTPGVAFNHFGGLHYGPSNNGGRLCWDCHDPHGDRSVASGFVGTTLLKMMQRYPVKARDADGRPLDADGSDDPGTGIEGLAAPIAFNAAVGGNTSLLDMADFRHATAGLCRNCHTTTSYHSAGSATNVHPENKTGWTSTDTCLLCHPHNNSFAYSAPPGNQDNCYVCHMSGKTADVLSYTPGTIAELNETEYGGANSGSGHFRSGTAYPSGNRAAAFASTGGTSSKAGTCAYCHDLALNHPASTPYALNNVFLLANVNALNRGGDDPENDVCLICHGTTGPGYDPPANDQLDDPPVRCNNAETGASPGVRAHGANCVTVGTAHYTAKHGTAVETAGKFCWNCHDPHGDGNDYMIQKNLMKEINATTGSPVNESIGAVAGFGFSANVDFRLAKDGTPGSLGFGDYKGAGDSLCGNCHNPTYINNPPCNWDGCATAHNDSGAGQCTSCHPHDKKFEGQGTCLGCHETSARGSSPVRRMVGPDFAQGSTVALTRSHHVGTGVAPPGEGSSFMGGSLTNNDCVVCHAEGYLDLTTGEVKTSSVYHFANGGTKTIDLRHADSPTEADQPPVVYAYDKSAISPWNASDPDWVSQTKNNLDPFCVSCHDDNGASTAYKVGEHNGAPVTLPSYLASPGNPFYDGTITNEYDRVPRPSRSGAPSAAGSVVDIKSMVYDNTGSGPGTGGTPGANPPAGTFSRHAIRGMSVSRYVNYQYLNGGSKSMWNWGRFVNTGITTEGTPQWNDASVMSCADCHTSDGANGAAGNAHGSNSEYLLKDSTRGATEGIYAEGSTYTYVCFQCHVAGHHNMSGDGLADEYNHGGNGAEFSSTEALVGAPRKDNDSNIYGFVCMNCHGGYGFGTIHGTSQVLQQGNNGGNYNAYRFTNGANMHFYVPGAWETTSTACFTLSTADTFGGCTQHPYTGKTAKSKTKILRPLSY